MAVQTYRVDTLTVAVARPAAPGDRPPVLLIHGMFGGAWYWRGYQTLLARHGYESHALNLRGHHGSRPVRDLGKVSLHDYVDDAIEVARALGMPFVIGHSMGGLVAQKVAERGACRAAVLLASAPPRWIPPVSWLLFRKQIKYLPQLVLGRQVMPDRADADALMFNRTPLTEREGFFRQLVPESGRAGLELSIGAMAVHAARVSCPMLVVGGSDDRFVVPRVARALSRKYRAALRSYDSFAHHIMAEPGWEQPATDIVHWLDSNA